MRERERRERKKRPIFIFIYSLFLFELTMSFHLHPPVVNTKMWFKIKKLSSKTVRKVWLKASNYVTFLIINLTQNGKKKYR
jgi:hypothetical protein